MISFTDFNADSKKKIKKPADRLSETVSVKSKISRFLSRSFAINLRQPSSTIDGLRLVVKLHGDSKYSTRHLLWKLIYKGVTTLEWFILFREFEDSLKESPGETKTKILGLLLSLSRNTRKRFHHWESSTKSVFKLLQGIDSEPSAHLKQNLLQYIVTTMKIPQKGDNVQNIYTYYHETFQQRKAKPLNRIGVGYKDKGSLRQGSDEEPLPLIPDWSPDPSADVSDFLKSALDFVKRIFPSDKLSL